MESGSESATYELIKVDGEGPVDNTPLSISSTIFFKLILPIGPI